MNVILNWAKEFMVTFCEAGHVRTAQSTVPQESTAYLSYFNKQVSTRNRLFKTGFIVN